MNRYGQIYTQITRNIDRQKRRKIQREKVEIQTEKEVKIDSLIEKYRNR